VDWFSRGGDGGHTGSGNGPAGARYGDGGSGGGKYGATGGNGSRGIVIIRFQRARVKRETRYSHIPLAINPLLKEPLHVFFNLGKFEPLTLADVKTESSSLKLTLAAEPAVRLWPRYIADYFAPVAFSQNTDDDYDPDNLYIGEPEAPHSYSIKKLPDDFNHIAFYSPLFFTNDAALPQRGVDGLLEFELKYRAFGAEASGGRVWAIKNGLYNAPDDAPELGGDGAPTGRGAGAGSYIPVKFGAGTPPEKKGEGTIINAE
jgi:hypothetical protein